MLIYYKTEIANLAARLRKAKVFGQEVELDKELDDLQQSAKQLEENTRYTGAASREPEQVEPETTSSPAAVDNERDLLEETARSPKVGLMLVGAEIEREARNLVISLDASARDKGARHGPMATSLTRNIMTLTEMGILPQGILKSLEQFRAVRSEMFMAAYRYRMMKFSAPSIRDWLYCGHSRLFREASSLFALQVSRFIQIRNARIQEVTY